MRTWEIILRLALMIVSTIVILYGHVTIWITAPLSAMAIVATTELAIRPYASNVFDRLLLICGTVVTALILVGLLLNLTPRGLTRESWALVLLVISMFVLARRCELGTRFRRPPISTNGVGLSIAISIVIVAGALLLSLAGVHQWDREPLMSFSLVSANSNSIVVEIHAVSFEGQYRIVATSQAAGARRYTSKAFYIDAGGNGETIRERVPSGTAGRWTIDLNATRLSSVARELIVDVHNLLDGFLYKI
jgi:hypothetical protein